MTGLSSGRGNTRWENLRPSDMSSIFLWDPLERLVRTIWPSKNSYGSVVDWVMVACKRLLNLMNFPEMIWLMIFVGPGEKPEPTIKGWCRTGRGVVTVFVLSSSEGTMKVELAPNADVESDKVHNSNNTGWVQNRTIVFTNKGTTKDCVPVH